MHLFYPGLLYICTPIFLRSLCRHTFGCSLARDAKGLRMFNWPVVPNRLIRFSLGQIIDIQSVTEE